MRIAGLILAGGRSSRFGADKALASFRGRPLICRSIEALGPHVEALALGGREALGLEAVADPPGAPEGPLAGVLGGLAWAGALGCTHLATAPCDTPFLPHDLVPRLADAIGAGPVIAARAERAHALCALWRADVGPELGGLARAKRQLSMQAIIAALGGGWVRFDDETAFANVNTRCDLAEAERRGVEAGLKR